ncbi:OLC1v1008643C1 [Oldenlandia corymbosa var. corymbosa]|uniref:OLC1v1008643C1 n=1 Tax=Oldenlandia corymbosa var. corymbosa TaxID=529605 RepID=A0AAV1DQB9_OLDCO|nr:OLC1v1008643C1 [Oldenlandia corymbosa var. corymbosa]
MELLYLLCSIVSSSITSLTLSVVLLLRRLVNPRAAADCSSFVSLYEGTVWHERRRPVHHSFQYNVRYALFDLDQAAKVPTDHLSGDQARRISETNGPVCLLTIPPSVGYEQNPLSLYYCYDIEGSTHNLKKCIAEVTNTPWGERVTFLFDPKSDTVAKPLHVSPFMDMLGSWSIKANAPEDNLWVAISVQHPELGNYFTATLRVKRTSIQIARDPALFFWLMPHRVAIWIYWHAFRLWWKGVSFIQHPRYHSPNYREEALLRDSQLQNKMAFGRNEDGHLQAEGSSSSNVAEKSQNPRCCVWRDAKWPWC